jgi:XFP C-terminal domain
LASAATIAQFALAIPGPVATVIDLALADLVVMGTAGGFNGVDITVIDGAAGCVISPHGSGIYSALSHAANVVVDAGRTIGDFIIRGRPDVAPAFERASAWSLRTRIFTADKQEGTTTTPFDMTVLNDLDRFHLAMDVVDRVPRLRDIGAHFKQTLRNKLIEHKQYVTTYGEDMPEIRDWRWGA